LSVGPTGDGLTEIVGGREPRFGVPGIFNGPAWSPTGASFAYVGRTKTERSGLFLINADGTGQRLIPATRGAAGPVFSPDGRAIAFARTRIVQPRFDPKRPLESFEREGFAGTTTWLLDLDTGRQRRLTPWRDGLHNMPSSFSPDSGTLAFTRHARGKAEAMALDLTTGRQTVLARNAEGPTYSPDGSRLAFISYRDRNVTEGFGEPVLASELYVRPVGEGPPLRLTRTHDWQEASPSWDPSGERLAYLQATGEEAFGLGFTNVIKQINADGTCRQVVFGKPRKRKLGREVAFHGPAWQPGPGREAGRIEC